MSWPPSPAWLLELQGRFGQVLRSPLQRDAPSPAAMTAKNALPEISAARGISASERLDIYHRQYWFRLWTRLQRAYPLTARLLGYAELNRIASEFLLEQPPRGVDLDAMVPGFAGFLARGLESCEPRTNVFTGDGETECVEPVALVEAAHIDVAHHRVSRAPAFTPFRPSPEDATQLLTGRLRLAPSVALLSEHWPLCALRQSLLAAPEQSAPPLGAASLVARRWLLCLQDLRVVLIPLEPGEADLLELLTKHSLQRALSELEASCEPEARAMLPVNAQRWLARSVELGLWAGVDRELGSG